MASVKPGHPVALPHILCRRQVLEVPRNMEPAKKRMLQWNNMVDMITGRAFKIDPLDPFIISRKGSFKNSSPPLRDVVPISLRVTVFPSPLNCPVALLVRGLPRLGSLIAFGCERGVLLARSLLNNPARCPIRLLPDCRPMVSAHDAGSIADLPFSNVTERARLAGIKPLSPLLSGFGARNNLIHTVGVTQAGDTSNGEFIRPREND